MHFSKLCYEIMKLNQHMYMFDSFSSDRPVRAINSVLAE